MTSISTDDEYKLLIDSISGYPVAGHFPNSSWDFGDVVVFFPRWKDFLVILRLHGIL